MATIQGYMIEADWDPDAQTLRARGTNKAGQAALRGDERNLGDVVLTRAEMADVKFRDAGALVNGHLAIKTTEGRKYQLHFRKKHADGFRWLARELGL